MMLSFLRHLVSALMLSSKSARSFFYLKRTRLFKTYMGGVFCCACRPQYINISEPKHSHLAHREYRVVKNGISLSGYNFNFEAVLKVCRGCACRSAEPQCSSCKIIAREWAQTGRCPHCKHNHYSDCNEQVVIMRDDVVVSRYLCECVYELIEVC